MGVNPDSSAALYPPPFSRPDETNGASTSSSSSSSTTASSSTSDAPAASAAATSSADSQPAPFSASTIASLFPSLHRSTSLSAHPAVSSSASASAPPTSALSPFLSRQLTNSRPSSSSPTPAGSEWRTSVTIEDRLQQRAKIRDAYNRQCGGSVSMLLEVVQAVEEELLFAGSGSRLDYFKAAIDYEARLRIKKQQLGLSTAAVSEASGGSVGTGGTTRIAVSTEGAAVKAEQQDGEQHEKDERDKRMEEEPEVEEEPSEGATGGAAEVDSEPSSKKQKS